MRYGLFIGDMKLEQIAGGGRIRVSRKGRAWWTKTTSGEWAVYPASTGQTYDSEEEAQRVAENLNA